MIRRIVWVIALLAITVGVPGPGVAQERTERFVSAAPPVMLQPPFDAAGPRSTYWKEGALIGAAVGVVAAIVMIDTSTMCTTGVPGHCDTNYAPRIIGGFLLGVGGGFLGGMLGASLPRASDHGS